jgi:hypothetical protein
MKFKEFFILSEQRDGDLKHTLQKIPQKHRDLTHGYRFKYQGGNVLKGDKEHIGSVDPDNQTITIAAPWNYGREYTILHEIAHIVWSKLTKSQQEEWKQIIKNTKIKKGDRQAPEELWAMAYANYFAKNKIVKFTHDSWVNFVKKICS